MARLDRIGKIGYDRNDILNVTHSGKVVYRGTFNELLDKQIPVAVKRILKGGSTTIVKREIEVLTGAEIHPNLVRYFGTEEDIDFYYIATELWDFNLMDYFEGKQHPDRRIPRRPLKGTLNPELRLGPKEMLQQCLAGVKHLHERDLVHREINPLNYVIFRKNGQDVIKLSDFGITKQMTRGEFSVSGQRGSEGWAPPEMQPNVVATAAVDVFSLGCIFAYILSGGGHPFGPEAVRMSKVFAGHSDLSDISDPLARQMISDMIRRDPKERCSLSAAENHRYFRQCHADFYDLVGEIPGLCVIINQVKFESRNERIGTNEDRDMLAQTFRLFGMHVEIHENLKALEIRRLLISIAERDLSVYQCLAICLLSHGEQGVVYGVNDVSVKISELMEYFQGENCRSLLNKPKMFIIAACQGGDQQRVAVSKSPSSTTAPSNLQVTDAVVITDPEATSFQEPITLVRVGEEDNLPNVTDFLEVYSTVEGYTSFRDVVDGTVFVQTLCRLLRSEAHREDLFTVLHKVNGEVAKWTAGNGRKQMPQIRSSLRKKLQLTRMSEQSFVEALADMMEHRLFNEIFQKNIIQITSTSTTIPS